MKFKSINTFCLFILLLVVESLCPIKTLADNFKYDKNSKTVEFVVCSPNFIDVTADVKKVTNGISETVAMNLKPTVGDNCLKLKSNNIGNDSDQLVIYGADELHNGQVLKVFNFKDSNSESEYTIANLVSVSNEAENKAKFYANNVADYFDHSGEKYAFNFIQGLNYGDQSLIGSVDLENSLNLGKKDGVVKGTVSGEQLASERAKDLGWEKF